MTWGINTDEVPWVFQKEDVQEPLRIRGCKSEVRSSPEVGSRGGSIDQGWVRDLDFNRLQGHTWSDQKDREVSE